jgi:hypothetical protein
VAKIIDDGQICTALKLSANRFLTAAHCISAGHDGTMDLSNILDPGLASFPVETSEIYIHPSWMGDALAQAGGSPFSYDVALIDLVSQTPNIPVAKAPHLQHIGDGPIGVAGPDGSAGLFVGYGCDPTRAGVETYKQSAHFSAISQQAWQASECGFSCGTTQAVALYAHEILAKETGASREGTCSGDSGGPLFRYTSAGGYQVVGVSSSGVNDVAAATTVSSGFTRLANVSGWLQNPHNGSLAPPFTGVPHGFLQSKHNLCVGDGTVAVGSRPSLVQCEGYDPNLHSTLWKIVPVSGTPSYHIKNPIVNLCFDIATVNQVRQVVLQTCSTAKPTQRWQFAQQGGSTGLFYMVFNQGFSTGNVLFAIPSSDSGRLKLGNAAFDTSLQWMYYR